MLPTLSRGTVLRALFPFQGRPTQRGPAAHFCLFVDRCMGSRGSELIVIAYGTSQLDEQLARIHEPGHGLFSVPSQYMKGSPMPGQVTHYLARHLAVVPPTWIHSHFRARFNFLRPEKGQTAQQAQLLQQFELFEDLLEISAKYIVDYHLHTGRVGLLGNTWRP